MPSIKKRVSGFIRQFSTPSAGVPRTNAQDKRRAARSPSSPPPRSPERCFITRYLGGEARPPGPEIQHGKTGYQLPFVPLGQLDPEVFAAYTGPGGGLTCITRPPPAPLPGDRPDTELDYIDIEGSRAASRRQSMSNSVLVENFEGLDQVSVKSNGHNLSNNGVPPAPKVPKSPTNYIDNTVMNIRVGDRIYKVDDRNKLKLVAESPDPVTPPPHTSWRESSHSDSLGAEFRTSEIVDVDTQLDLIETEDGYMPISSLSSKNELDEISKQVRKRVTIRSPKRPNSLNLGSQSRISYTSMDYQPITEEQDRKSGNSSPLKNGFVETHSQHEKNEQQTHKISNALSSRGQSKSTSNVTPTALNSEYPELQNIPKSLASPSSSDTTVVEKKLEKNLKDDISTSIAGVRYWNRPNDAAYGLSDTLYELHPHTRVPAGSPIADTFAVVARKNSAILVLGDGVNWGSRAALASRAAVHGAMDYLNQALFGVTRTRSLTTQDVFQILLRSFHAAHCLILEEEAMLTTLTAAVVLPTKDTDGGSKFHLCVCNVGDSLAYVYSQGQVREATQGSHDITTNRDMRDALGALGPVDGLNPELSNLTCSITEVLSGDIVFLTSDGVSDNFDPVVGKFCVPKKPERSGGGGSQGGRGAQTPSGGGRSNRSNSLFDAVLPTVEAFQRHELTLLRMEDILNQGSGSVPLGMENTGLSSAECRVTNSAELCHRMLDFCQRLTTAKRKILEDPELYPRPEDGPDKVDQKVRRRRVCEKLALVPGKLDHATIAAYQVGDRSLELAGYQGDRTDLVGSVTPGLALAAPHASCEDLTMRESPVSSDGDDLTPTASISLDSTPVGSGCSSLAATPTHHPSQSLMFGQLGR